MAVEHECEMDSSDIFQQFEKTFCSILHTSGFKYLTVDQLSDLSHEVLNVIKERATFECEKEEEILFMCQICKSLLNEPVTIPCGHTFCMKCIEHRHSNRCEICYNDMAIEQMENSTETIRFRNNIMLTRIMEKWFSTELLVTSLRAHANKLFNDGNIEKAIMEYTSALELGPADHLLLSNRCHAYCSQKKYALALKDAEAAISACAHWPKGYFRKGSALLGLGFYTEAIVAFIQCLTLDPNAKSAHIAIATCFGKLQSDCESMSEKEESEPSNTIVLNTHSGCSMYDLVRSSAILDLIDESETLLQQKLYDAGCVTEITKQHLDDSGEEINSDDPSNLEPSNRNHSHISVKYHDIGIRCVEQQLCDNDDFECTICYRLLYAPVTTPCGHVFCCCCLYQCLDHRPECPLCKHSLRQYLAERRQAVTVVLNEIIAKYFPTQHDERQTLEAAEIEQISEPADSSVVEIPVFVATMAYPKIMCPLHIFEPRYRLMIRQCMESGTQQFGMCIPSRDGNSFADYGTMLQIQDVQYAPDGRALVNCIGGRRFHVLSRGQNHGYNTAKVQLLRDTAVDNFEDLQELHTTVHRQAQSFFGGLTRFQRLSIIQNIGNFPVLEPDFTTLPDGPAWTWWVLALLPIQPEEKLDMLAIDNFSHRLIALRRALQNYPHGLMPE